MVVGVAVEALERLELSAACGGEARHAQGGEESANGGGNLCNTS